MSIRLHWFCKLLISYCCVDRIHYNELACLMLLCNFYCNYRWLYVNGKQKYPSIVYGEVQFQFSSISVNSISRHSVTFYIFFFSFDIQFSRWKYISLIKRDVFFPKHIYLEERTSVICPFLPLFFSFCSQCSPMLEFMSVFFLSIFGCNAKPHHYFRCKGRQM